MPIYEFKCTEHGKFDKLVSFAEIQDVTCPLCGEKAQRMFSVFGFTFGWRWSDPYLSNKGAKEEFVRDV